MTETSPKWKQHSRELFSVYRRSVLRPYHLNVAWKKIRCVIVLPLVRRFPLYAKSTIY